MSRGEINSAEPGGSLGVQRFKDRERMGKLLQPTSDCTDPIVTSHHTMHFGRGYARKKVPDSICKITIGIRETRPIDEA